MKLSQKIKSALRYPAIVAGSYFMAAMPVVAQGETEIERGVNAVQPEDTVTDLYPIIQNILNTMLFIVGVASVAMLIIGGIRYVVSAGDQNAVTGAKNTILYAIVGIIISFLAFALVNFVIGRLGGDENAGSGLGAFIISGGLL